MALSPGTRIGAYEVTAKIGEGGMGEVYRATDTHLKRQVAIKVLPDAVASDPYRLARFQREAEMLAAINHPNIAQIYGLEKTASTIALVMELVDGEDLAYRLRRGPISIAEALPMARQIAEALEAAHERGIIHRDLKPSNIKVHTDGTVKVLDFGLAKAMDRELECGDQGLGSAVANSPTISLSGMTAAGAILGTAAYMAPEQAKGLAVDRRADVWAFGCVLFEMLTGQRTFAAADASSTLAYVITKEPDWTTLSASTPPSIRRLLRRCLEKDPKQRLQSIGDARIEIDETLAEPFEASARLVASRFSARSWALILATTVVALLIAALGALFIQSRSGPVPQMVRLRLGIDAPWEYLPTTSGSLAISPDGTRIAYVATDGRSRQLFVRRLDLEYATAISGTNDAAGPFFSPDGKWISFSADNRLRKVPSEGGLVTDICTLSAPTRGAVWAKNMIFFALATPGGVYRVSAGGGDPVSVTRPSESEVFHRTPWATNDDSILYGTVPPFEDGGVNRMDAAGRRTVLLSEARDARVTRSRELTFMRGSSLFVAPYDARSGQLSGPPREAAKNVLANVAGADYSISDSGTLVYAEGQPALPPVSLVWVSRTGITANADVKSGHYQSLALSPDGSKIALALSVPSRQIEVHDFTEKESRPVTVSDTNENPVWTPDGKRLTYRNMRLGDEWGRVLVQPVDGSGKPITLVQGASNRDHHRPVSWSGDGQVLFMENIDGTLQAQVAGGSAELIKVVGVGLHSPQISWDGKWLAYVASEGGIPRVYVQPFPSLVGRWMISPDGGLAPRWTRDGRRLMFISAGKMMEVSIDVVSGFRASPPRVLFEGSYSNLYDMTSDGERFLMVRQPPREPIRSLTVVLNSLH